VSRKREQAKRKQPIRVGFGWVRPLLALATVAGSMLGLTLMLEWMHDARAWPVNQVRIGGELRHLQPTQLQQAITPLTAAGFFVMDVGDIQTHLQALPWVDRVSVRRVWPDQLYVDVQEQRAVAHWGAQSFINARAEVFAPEQALAEDKLPHLSGPDGYQRRVLSMYLKMGALLKPLQLGVAQVALDERRAWHLRLSNGLTLAVGRSYPLQRVARFVSVYPAILAAGEGRLTTVDLRYSNGFAAHWQAAATLDKRAG